MYTCPSPTLLRRLRLTRPAASLAALALGLMTGFGALAGMPMFSQVKADWRSSEAWLLDRSGQPLQELRLDPKVRRTEWVSLDRISPALVAAVVQAEDQRFFDHAGVDWLALGSATLNNLLMQKPRGASTITMQLVSLIDADHKARGVRRNIPEKWDQIQAARNLEETWSKRQVLEAYFNLLPMRGELVGIDATARALFDKRPGGLDPGESILIAALIRSPNAKPADVTRRACALGAQMPGAPDCKTLNRLTHNSLSGRYPISPRANLAPKLASRLLERPGQRLTTTLDLGIQQMAGDILQTQLALLAGRNVQDAAALVLDHASGHVLAYVTRSGPASDSPLSDGILAPRQAGSTLKPFLYALALERRYLTAASLLDDTPLTLATAGGQYAPENYDRLFRGQASLRYALASSLNIPAVATLDLMGEEPFANLLTRLGFSGLTEAGDFYGPALALGSLDVSLWELTNAYRTLANGGLHSPATLLPRPEPARARILGRESSYIIGHILADREARADTFGLESALATRYWSAVKTGTSKDMRDNWSVGYSDRYTVGVWVGNHSGDPMHDVSGISGAAPAWRLIMDRLHGQQTSRAPRPPRTLERHRVQLPGEPPREEWFLPGTAPSAQGWQPALPPARITTPTPGALLTLDPDIPESAQRMHFTARHAPEGSHWELNGQRLDTPDWRPLPGKHRLRLLGPDGQELDSRDITVR